MKGNEVEGGILDEKSINTIKSCRGSDFIAGEEMREASSVAFFVVLRLSCS